MTKRPVPPRSSVPPGQEIDTVREAKKLAIRNALDKLGFDGKLAMAFERKPALRSTKPKSPAK